MKKSFLLLPITVAILTACSSDAPAPVENADGTLSPGIMQPVDNPSMGGNTSWEPQIQQSSVPNSMNGPIPQAPTGSICTTAKFPADVSTATGTKTTTGAGSAK